MKITGLDSVCIWSENPHKLSYFYEKTLGLKVDSRIDIPGDKGISFKINEVILFIGYHDKVKGAAKDPYRIMVGFAVPSVKEAYSKLSKKGVKFILKASPSPDGTYYVATALDPEGNIIQFFSTNP